jgi:uncharacterized protein DUF4261
MCHPLRWSAIIALDSPMLPALERVAASLTRLFSDAPPLAVSQSTERLLTCTFGEQSVAATLVPHPIEPSQLEGPCATAWYWPEAADALRGHSAHLLVMLVDEGGSAVNKSRRLTQFVTALADQTEALGILWGPGRLIHQRAAFTEQARQMTQDNLPLYLWVDFRIEQADPADQTNLADPSERTDATTLRLYTTGLEALGQTELEVAHYSGQPQQLIEFVYNVAHYLLDQCKTVHDGERIGLSEQVQATIHHARSMVDGKTEVLRLEF